MFGAWKKSWGYYNHCINSGLYSGPNHNYGHAMQGYSSLAIARLFLQKAIGENKPITPMKMLKLIFIAHGWHLAFFQKPLIADTIQAWKYGPVIPSVYRYFKEYGSNPVPPSELSILPTLPPDTEQATKDLLERVWDKYSPLSATQLSSLTHQTGTPWYDVTGGGTSTEKFVQIPDALICQFYKQKLEPKPVCG
jgi:uncharacterized phage-associated protein